MVLLRFDRSWGPIRTHNYVYQGTYDPEYLPSKGDIDVTFFLESTIQMFLDHKEKATRAPRGQQEVFYFGEECEIKILVKWVMEGTALSYLDCHSAIEGLLAITSHYKDLDTHQMHAEISQNGQTKIAITVTIEQGKDVTIDDRSILSFKGQYWNQRRLAGADIRRTIDGALSDLQRFQQTSLVDSWHYHTNRNWVSLTVWLHHDFQRRWPRFTYADLVTIVESIRDFYSGGRSGAGLCGYIYYGEVNLGIFDIEIKSPLPPGPQYPFQSTNGSELSLLSST